MRIAALSTVLLLAVACGDGFADEADVDDEMLMYGLEGTDA